MGKLSLVIWAVVFTVFIAGGIIALLVAWPLMLLWNWLLPVIFGVKVITFWQAFGLVFLTNILFKSHFLFKSHSVNSKKG